MMAPRDKLIFFHLKKTLGTEKLSFFQFCLRNFARVEALTSCFDFLSRAHLNARPKRNSRDRVWLVQSTVEHGRNMPQAR